MIIAQADDGTFQVKNIFFMQRRCTYIMHFLEPARFLNAPDLAGRKVNVLYDLGLAERPPHSSCLHNCGFLGPETTTLFSFA